MTRTVCPADILLPRRDIARDKWAVIACDQFTQDGSYWDKARSVAGGSYTTLDLVLPEIYLDEADRRVPRIHDTMDTYLVRGVLEQAVTNGYVYVERQTLTGLRRGLVAAIDLDQYDPSPLWKGSIRSTEGVVPERVPPRAFIRRGAPIELPHVLMLINDPSDALFSFLGRVKHECATLYDFDTMLSGGHMRGYGISGETAAETDQLLMNMESNSPSPFLAVGDGNHSLAAAKQIRLEYLSLHPGDKSHPSRYALAEIVNLFDPAIVFEPIHRVFYGIDPAAFEDAVSDMLPQAAGNDIRFVSGGRSFSRKTDTLPCCASQELTEKLLGLFPGSSVDYIHGKDAVMKELEKSGTAAIMPRPLDKSELFPYIEKYGPLPRKSFSMGEATDKRYYMEARRII